MAEYYLWDKDTDVVRPAKDVTEWAMAFEDYKGRQLAVTKVDGYTVSTVFLGLNHRFTDAEAPLIFETMIFKDDTGAAEVFCERYATPATARANHAHIVKNFAAILKQIEEENE